MTRYRHQDLTGRVTGTGGGDGDPLKRPRDRVDEHLRDLKNGYITTRKARRDYGYDPDAGAKR